MVEKCYFAIVKGKPKVNKAFTLNSDVRLEQN